MYVNEDQIGLSKDKLKKGDKVLVLIVNANMCLVEKDGKRYWINEKFLNK